MKLVFLKTVTLSIVKVKTFTFMLLIGLGLNMQGSLHYESPTDQLNSILVDTTDEEYLEAINTNWFNEFRKNQKEGKDIEQADLQAAMKAIQLGKSGS